MAASDLKRLGLLVPPANTTMEDDFARWMPADVRMHVNRLNAPTNSKGIEYLQSIGDHVEETARLMAMVSVGAIAFGCTSGSFLHGAGYDSKIIDRIERASGGIKAIATARAVVDALNHFGVHKIAACSPYSEEVNRRLRAFYTDAGFDIVNFEAVDRAKVGKIDNAEPEVALDLARSVDRPDAEAVFISCTAFRGAAEVIDQLEDELGKPVVTSNQATFWACLEQLAATSPMSEGGKLLRERTKVLVGRG